MFSKSNCISITDKQIDFTNTDDLNTIQELVQNANINVSASRIALRHSILLDNINELNIAKLEKYEINTNYKKITDPITGGNININTLLGKKIIKRYINELMTN